MVQHYLGVGPEQIFTDNVNILPAAGIQPPLASRNWILEAGKAGLYLAVGYIKHLNKISLII